MTQLRELVEKVQTLRATLENQQGYLRGARAAWESAHATELENVKSITAELTAAEATLREAALAAYKATGNKAPGPGVGIREVSRIAYDEQTAFLWAQEHKLALKLDKPAFEKVAKVNALPFVTVRQEAQAIIAMDLGKALAEEKP